MNHQKKLLSEAAGLTVYQFKDQLPAIDVSLLAKGDWCFVFCQQEMLLDSEKSLATKILAATGQQGEEIEHMFSASEFDEYLKKSSHRFVVYFGSPAKNILNSIELCAEEIIQTEPAAHLIKHPETKKPLWLKMKRFLE